MPSQQKKIDIETRKPFEETLHGLFYDLFRRAGLNIPVNRIDQFRGGVKKMTILINTETKVLILREINALQDRVKGAIQSVSEHLTEHENSIKGLDERLKLLEENKETDVTSTAAKQPDLPGTSSTGF